MTSHTEDLAGKAGQRQQMSTASANHFTPSGQYFVLDAGLVDA